MIGTTVGKYRIVGQLGRGGMGIVYRALDETLGREVAIKVLNPEIGDSDVLRRFRAEAVTLARLTHPGIATIYDLAESEHGLLMVMELVRGESLDRLSARAGPLLPERAAYIVVRVLRALEYAHRAGVVHRDMKPGNVMVTEDGGVKVMDFGVARVRDTAHLTDAGHLIGTPAYMAPEQVLGKEVDGRADLYSVGVVLYRLLTGALPFKADTAIAMAQKQLTEHPTPLGQHQAGLPEWCDVVLRRALAKSPDDRFQTAEEFRQALARAVPAAVEEVGDATWFGQLEATTPPRPVPAGAAGAAATPQRLPTGAWAGQEPGPAPVAAAQPDTVAPATRSTPVVGTAAPSPTGDTTIVVRGRHLAVGAALLALLALSVAALAVVVLRRPPGVSHSTAVSSGPASAGAAATPAAASASDAASPAVGASAAPPAAVPASPSAVATAPPPPAAPARPASAVPPGPDPARATRMPPAGVGPVTSTSEPAGRTAAPAGRGPAAAPSAPALPSLMLDARTLIAEGGRARERRVRLALADDQVILSPEEGGDPLQAVPYASIMSVSYSKGRNPLWRSPGGPVPVLQAEGGALGVFRGERHWLSMRTRERFVVVRVEGRDADRAIALLEARTGRAVDRVSGPVSTR
jgi:serine/threonine-protein kinase